MYYCGPQVSTPPAPIHLSALTSQSSSCISCFLFLENDKLRPSSLAPWAPKCQADVRSAENLCLVSQGQGDIPCPSTPCKGGALLPRYSRHCPRHLLVSMQHLCFTCCYVNNKSKVSDLRQQRFLSCLLCMPILGHRVSAPHCLHSEWQAGLCHIVTAGRRE